MPQSDLRGPAMDQQPRSSQPEPVPLAVLACPECGTALTEQRDIDGPAYTCERGHHYSREALLIAGLAALDIGLLRRTRDSFETLAVRARGLAKVAREHGEPVVADALEGSAREAARVSRGVRTALKRRDQPPAPTPD